MDLLQVETRDQTVDRIMNDLLNNDMTSYKSNNGINHSEVSTWLIRNRKKVMESSLTENFYKFCDNSLTKEIKFLEKDINDIHDLKKNLEKKQKEEKSTLDGGFRQSKKSKRKSNKTKNVKRLRSRRNKK